MDLKVQDQDLYHVDNHQNDMVVIKVQDQDQDQDLYHVDNHQKDMVVIKVHQ
jgi:hypothetical protein